MLTRKDNHRTSHWATGLLLIIFSLFFSPAGAQTITGTVSEMFGGSKEPVMGANVVLVNQQNRYVKGAVTDLNGQYHLQVPKDAKNLRVQVSYIGKKTQSVKYTGQTVHLYLRLACRKNGGYLQHMCCKL